MAAGTQDTAGYFVWEVAGKPVAVHLHLDVVDRILSEVMRGFGAVPKRGAEVGGVLIGTIEHGDTTIVRVEDFETVECEYKRGPSFLFVDEDRHAFEQAVARWQPDATRPAYAVGMFRSHTRDGMSLGPEDVALMDGYFPSPAHIALLIKPYGTKVSMAGFFFREDGNFQETTPLEFPFRRRELGGDEPAPRRPLTERGMERRARNRAMVAEFEPRTPAPVRFAERESEYTETPPQPGAAYAVTLPSRSRLRSAMWIPLSFVFLLFGVALGMMIALTRAPSGHGDATDFSLGLAVSSSDDNLNVRWDRQSAAIRTAQRGVLEIEDGSYTKSVELKSVDLHSGSILFRNASPTVRFRLTVYPQDRVSVSETAEWKR
jgi:hypothetical protein